MALRAFAAALLLLSAGQQSIDISCRRAHGSNGGRMGQTGRQTNGHHTVIDHAPHIMQAVPLNI